MTLYFATREEWLKAARDEIVRSEKLQIETKINISCGFPPGTRGKADFVVYEPELSAAREWEVFISPGIAKPDLVLRAVSGALHDIAYQKGFGDHFDPTLSLDLGDYPHAEVTKRPTKKTYMVLCKCDHCGYQVRTTKRWLKKGMPHCPDLYRMSVVQD